MEITTNTNTRRLAAALGAALALIAVPAASAASAPGGLVTVTEAERSIERVMPAVLAPAAGPKFEALAGLAARSGTEPLYRVVNTDVPTRVSSEARAGFSVGTGAKGVTFRPVGVASTATTGKMSRSGAALIYANTDTASDTVVRPVEKGAETFTHIRTASAPTTYSWTVGDRRLALREDGSVDVLDRRTKRIVVHIPAPWSKDAAGRSVPTHFRIADNTLTLVVEHRKAEVAYPVIADPVFQWAWHGVTVLLSKGETRWLGGKGALAGGVLGARAGALGAAVGALIGSVAGDAVNWMVDRGYCLAGYASWWGGRAVWFYRGWGCW